MPTPLLPEWSNRSTVLIGMLHLEPLPGTPRYGGDMNRIEQAVHRDAEALVKGGADALLMENFGDAPFHPGPVPPEVVGHLTVLAERIHRRFGDLPLGINVLRNDGCAALAIAHAVGARFIRVNVLCGARVTDQGILQGIAHDLLRRRAGLGARDVRIFADVDVKHSSALGETPIEQQVTDTIQRGLADAVIVSGPGTGRSIDRNHLERIRRVCGETPLLVGSGVNAESAGELASMAEGLIVGTALKRGGVTSRPVDVGRVRALRGLLG